MSIDKTMNHKQFCFMPQCFDLATHLYLRQSKGDKVGDEWETSGKTHTSVVEHDFILRQQENTRGVMKRDKRETPIVMMKEQDTATKADIGLETKYFGDRSVWDK